MTKQLNILELFAGVGGFRIGFENADPDLFKTKWSNQFEPGKKSQDAFEVYDYRFPDSENINRDINEISDEELSKMNADMIVGGFPCQDYSVARSSKNEMGINGKKGVLFWQIIRAIRQIKPRYLILENVDRLLKAPSNQRGRDFAIMLSALNNSGYYVEWRVINASEYGRRQRRKRVYFFIYRKDCKYGQNVDKRLNNKVYNEQNGLDFLLKGNLFAKQFPVKRLIYKDRKNSFKLGSDIKDISDTFTGNFYNTGFMVNGRVLTIETQSDSQLQPIPLRDTLQKEVDEKYFVDDQKKIERFKYLRGAKKVDRVSADGHKYTYSEGAMSPYEDLNLPSRTMLTSEGSVNRSTHWLKIGNRYRTLTPIETERLQDFPDDWTKYKLHNHEIKEVNDRMRMFFMGNALVTDIVKQIGLGIKEIES